MKNLSLIILLTLSLLGICSGLKADATDNITITSNDIKHAPEIGSIRKIQIHNTCSYRLVDMNNDGRKDLVAYTEGEVNYISIRTTDRLSIAEIPLKEPLRGLFCCRDISNDNIPEVFFISVEKFNVSLNIYNPATRERKSITIFRGKNIFSDKIYDVNLYDVKLLKHSNGDRLLLVTLSTGHDDKPRGILAFTLPAFKPVWDFLIGSPILDKINLYDINNDGKTEIFFSTVATDNGFSLNGYSDDRSYFGVLDENGNELYKHEYSGPLSYCFFNVIIPENDIVLYGYSNDQKSLQPDVIMLNGKDYNQKLTYHTQIRRQYYSSRNNFIRENHEYSHSFFDVHNCCYLLNNRLQLEKTIQFPNQLKRTFHFRHADGTFYYLFVLEDIANKSSILLLLNNNLDIVGKQNYPVQFPANFTFDKIGKDGAVYFVDGLTQIIYEWYLPIAQLKPVFNLSYFAYKYKKLLLILASLIILMFAITTIANIISRKNLNIQKYKSLSDYFMENPFEAIILINDNGIISDFNNVSKKLFSQIHPENYLSKPYEKLIERVEPNILINNIQNALKEKDNLFQKIPELDISIENKNYKLKTEIQRVFLNKKHFTIVLKFLDLTAFMRADRISNWAAIAQKLAHEIKNPLMSMTLSLGRLEKTLIKQGNSADPGADKYLNFIRDDIERMRDSANQFMRFTSSLDFAFIDCQLNEVITELVHDYKFLFSERIEFITDLAEALPVIHIDLEQTKQILKYIIDNGIDAIEGAGRIQLKTTVIEKLPDRRGLEKKYVQLTIADSGTGIAEENRAKIFEPGFTTKETGAGFGMAIAKHVIEEQGGFIAVSGKKDVGTIITIEFPITESGNTN